MSRTRMGRRASIAVAVLSVAAAIAAAVPAAADDAASGMSRLAPTPPPLTDQARSAARAVQHYLDTTPKPVRPSIDAVDQHQAYEQAALTWITEFPFAAGVAQWGCTALDWEHSLVPSSDGGPDDVTSWWTIRCPSGYVPAYGDFFTVRPDVSSTPDAVASVSPFPELCQLILKGEHCFMYSTNPVTGETVYSPTYFWAGDSGPTYGRLRVGSAPPVWPACSEGSTIAALPVQSLQPNTGVGAAFPPAPGTVKSLIWEEADASGNIIGVRSMRCGLETGPTSE